MKRKIRLTESALRRIVKESVKMVLKERGFNDNGLEYEFYVAADSASDYFNDYDEAYK